MMFSQGYAGGYQNAAEAVMTEEETSIQRPFPGWLGIVTSWTMDHSRYCSGDLSLPSLT